MPETAEPEAQAIITVKRGDYMLFDNVKNAWFKASEDTLTTRNCPTLSRALEPFEYEADSGAMPEPTEALPNLPVAQFFRKSTPAGTHGPGTPDLPAGHRKVMSKEEANKYINYWERGIVKTAIYQGKGIRTVMGFDGLITHRFSVSQINPEW